MHATESIRTALMAVALSAVCLTANAQRHHRWHHASPLTSCRPVVVVNRPTTTTHVSNRFSQKERLAMAVAYIETHGKLTAKQYAKLTKLSRDTAEAELDAFALDRSKTIQMVVDGKKKIYVKRA